MDPRTEELIDRLGLVPHPEGGYFREAHRSSERVLRARDGASRAALTSIYFLLGEAGHSVWHRVGSDEVWQFLEGDPLDLHVAGPGFDRVETIRLGPVGGDLRPIATVPAGIWQAARSTGRYSLVACAVGPGFEYDDFTLLRDFPGGREAAAGAGARWAELV